MERDGLSIEQLAEQAGVSVRTVRYYISQGLLPGPGARGKYASYGDEHLARLQLIRKLVDQHVPLAEQRQRLQELSADDLRHVLQEEEQHSRVMEQAPSPREYVSRLLSHARTTRAEFAAAAPLHEPAPSAATREPSAAPTPTPTPTPTPVPTPRPYVAAPKSAPPPAPASHRGTPGSAAAPAPESAPHVATPESGQAPWSDVAESAPLAAMPVSAPFAATPVPPVDASKQLLLTNTPASAPPAATPSAGHPADASRPPPMAAARAPAPALPAVALTAAQQAAFRRRTLLTEAADETPSPPLIAGASPEQLQRWELVPGVELLVTADAAARHANLIARLLQTARAFLPRRDTTP
jgi:DNA-binding transcriptional MerR regulator